MITLKRSPFDRNSHVVNRLHLGPIMEGLNSPRHFDDLTDISKRLHDRRNSRKIFS